MLNRYYITFREKDVNEANESIVLVKRMPIEFVQVDERIALTAGEGLKQLIVYRMQMLLLSLRQ